MREFIWNIVAKIVSQPRIADAIIKFAMRKPFGHLPGYMDRWEITPQTMPSLIPGVIRRAFKLEARWGLPFAIRVHHILSRDVDPHIHDHPWNFRTIVLRGYYTEEDSFGERHFRRVGDTYKRYAHETHTIVDIAANEEVWTLFITGRWRNRWGFYVGNPPRKVYYRDYVSPYQRPGAID